MILCPKCNKELSVNALFCTECGERIIPQCPNCGVMLTNEANYCPKCGALLNSCHNVKATKALINATVSPQEILLGIEDISETSEVEKNKSNTKNEWFFIKYWRGNYSLGKSIFIFVLIIFSTSILVPLLTNKIIKGLYLIWVCAIAIAILIIHLYQIGGCWRSVNKYKGKKIWKYLTYTFITAISFIYFIYGPAAWHYGFIFGYIKGSL